MARTPRVVTDRSDVVGQAIAKFVEKVVKFVTLEVHANLQDSPPLGTPVDTGWARSNWVPNVGDVAGGPFGSKQSVSDSYAEIGTLKVLTFKLSDKFAFVSNNVPYIIELNDGYSPQSPPLFVDTAVARGVNATEGAFGGEQ